MKKLLFLLIHINFIFAAFFSNAIAGKVIVTGVKGEGFISRSNGQTVFIKKNLVINQLDDILVEENSFVSLKGPYDQMIHVSGGSHFSIDYKDKKILLKKGSLWIQAYRNEDKYYIETVNGRVDFYLSDVIVHYDEELKKTQTLVLTGDANLSNLFEKNYIVNIQAGFFSFIKQDYENGSPRTPTKIGQNAFLKMTARFQKVVPLDKGIVNLYKKNNHKLNDRIEELQNQISSFDIEPTKVIKPEVNLGNIGLPSKISLESQKKEEAKKTQLQKKAAQQGNRSISSLKPKIKFVRSKMKRTPASAQTAKRRSNTRHQKLKVRSFKINWDGSDQSSNFDYEKAISAKRNPSFFNNSNNKKYETDQYQFEKNTDKIANKDMIKLKPHKKNNDHHRDFNFEKEESDSDYIEIKPYRSKTRSTSSLPAKKEVTNFEESLEFHYKKQQKHSNEMNTLIRDLESVSQDFTETY